MKLLVKNIHTKAVKINKKEIKVLSRAMSFPVPGHQYMPSFRQGIWDGKKRFFHKGYKTFLTGLLPFVLKLADKDGFKVKIVDERDSIKIKKSNLRAGLSILRKYQRKEVKKVLKFKLTNIPWLRGVLKHPTGSGKTFVIAGIIRALNKRTLIIVDGLELLYQTKADLEQALGFKIGIIGDQKFKLRKFTVATMQTLKVRRNNEGLIEYLGTVKVLVSDEAHRVDPAKSGPESSAYSAILARCSKAFARLGFSATPLVRGDLGDVTLIGHSGEIISRIDRKYLEKKGWLAKVAIHIIKIRDPRLKGRRMKYATVYDRGIINNDERNSIIIEEAIKAYKRGDLTLILARRRNHGRKLYQMIKSHKSVPTLFFHGDTDIKKRKRIVRRLKKHPVPMVVVTTAILDQGVNIPEVKTIILAGGGASRIKSIQRVGRGSRPKKHGENKLTVIDFKDRTHEYLEQHSGERIAAYEAEGLTVVH